MSVTLFGREANLVVGNLDLSNLDIAFKIKKSLKSEPNTCEIRVWNINSDHRKQIETTPEINVSLYAGYQGNTSLLYLGQVRTSHSRIDGPDIVTELSTGDSSKAIKKSRINIPVGPKTPLSSALNSIVGALGVGSGNVASAVATLQNKGIVNMYPSGTVISGSASKALTDFCKTAGLSWSIQDGVLQILDLNKPLNATAVVLSPSTGLIESPAFETDKTLINAKCLLIPDIYPGRVVEFQTRDYNGQYYITQVESTGDTFGNEWYHNITCKKY